MKPAWEAIQRGMTFLTALPELAQQGKLENRQVPDNFDEEWLAALARDLGYDTEPEALAEAFRIRMLARSAVLSRMSR